MRALVDAELDTRLDAIWDDERSAADPRTRPAGWFPGDVGGPPFSSGDWLTCQARPTDPELCDLPDELMAIGRSGASMVSGVFITFSVDQLEELRATAERHGYQLVRDDDAAYGCWLRAWQ